MTFLYTSATLARKQDNYMSLLGATWQAAAILIELSNEVWALQTPQKSSFTDTFTRKQLRTCSIAYTALLMDTFEYIRTITPVFWILWMLSLFLSIDIHYSKMLNVASCQKMLQSIVTITNVHFNPIFWDFLPVKRFPHSESVAKTSLP